MKYDAITLDTNIFQQHGLNFESGVLAQLSQFQSGYIEFVLSEIVVREVTKHLISFNKESLEKINTALRDYKRSRVNSEENVLMIEGRIRDSLIPEDAAINRITEFQKSTNYTVVKSDLTDVGVLVRKYFSFSAPFEATGRKKSEFPDAIALLSLEKWSEQSDKKVLAVSTDLGWAAFAESSNNIDVETNLSTALSLLQQHLSDAEKHILDFLSFLDSDASSDIYSKFFDDLSEAIDEMEVTGEASSAHAFDSDTVQIKLKNFEFSDENNSERTVTVIRIGSSKIVAQVSLWADVTAECDFSMFVWDSIDKEDIPMGITHAVTDEKIQLNVLLHLEGDFSDFSSLNIVSMEIIDGIDEIYFGDIEIDYRFGEDYADRLFLI